MMWMQLQVCVSQTGRVTEIIEHTIEERWLPLDRICWLRRATEADFDQADFRRMGHMEVREYTVAVLVDGTELIAWMAPDFNARTRYIIEGPVPV